MSITRTETPLIITKKIRAVVMAVGAVGAVAAALASGGVASAATVVPTTTVSPTGSVTVRDPGTVTSGTTDAETVKKGARITGADRAKLA
jgi:hypothetical protein